MAYAPAWSIGSGKRSTDWRGGNAPGPGAYNALTSNRQSSPTWRIGSASRSTENRNNVPGPGAYNSPGKLQDGAPKYTIGMKTSQSIDNFTPGPGAYDQNGKRGVDHSSPSYSMRPKTATKSENYVPGPGAYDQSSRIQNSSAGGFKMGSAQRDDLYKASATPGPGTYTTRPQSAYNGHSGPKYGFGSEQKGGIDNMSKTLPGPGQYNYKNEFDSPGKGVSMGARRPESASFGATRSPGPGAYNPLLTDKLNGPSYKMGSATRDGNSNRTGSPGPGAYNPDRVKSGSNVKIGTSTRNNLNANAYTPGPGTYDSGNKIGNGPKYAMNPRREDVTKSKNDKFVPGPGAYSPSTNLTKYSQSNWKMGTSQRGELHSARANPGPGQYDVRKGLGGPKYGFGSQSRGYNPKSDTPGPGQYDHKHHVGDVANYVYGGSPLKIKI